MYEGLLQPDARHDDLVQIVDNPWLVGRHSLACSKARLTGCLIDRLVRLVPGLVPVHAISGLVPCWINICRLVPCCIIITRLIPAGVGVVAFVVARMLLLLLLVNLRPIPEASPANAEQRRSVDLLAVPENFQTIFTWNIIKIFQLKWFLEQKHGVHSNYLHQLNNVLKRYNMIHSSTNFNIRE